MGVKAVVKEWFTTQTQENEDGKDEANGK